MKKLLTLVISISLLCTLAACNGNSKGPSADSKCLGGDSSSSSTSSTASSAITSGASSSTSDSSGGDTAAKIDAALRNCKIITTIVNKVKKEVIGQGGFGSPSLSMSGGGGSFNVGGTFSTDSITGAGGGDSSCGDTSDEGLTGLGAKGIFESFTTSSEFQGAIGAAFTLYVILYGVALAAGMTQASMGEAIIKIAKLAVIAALATSWGFFYQVIGGFFVEGTDEIIGYFLRNFSQFYTTPTGAGGVPIAGSAEGAGGASSIFTSLDNFIARIFSYQTYAFVMALFNAGPYAPVYAAILIFSLLWVLQGVIKVVGIYVYSLFAKAILFAVAPIFLLFLLFKPTERLFYAWLSQLVSFSLQPIFVMAFLGLFAQLLQPFFDDFAKFKLCWMQLKDSNDKFGWKFVQQNGSGGGDSSTSGASGGGGSTTGSGGSGDTSTYSSSDYGVHSSPPISLQAVLLFGFFSYVFINSLNMVNAIVGTITNSGANLADLVKLNQINASEGNLGSLAKKRV